MAPGGPWDHFPRPECSKRWHGDPFGDIFDFWLIFAQKQCASVLNRNNFCVAQRQKGGRPAGGGRVPGGRANSDPTGVPSPTQDCNPPAGRGEDEIFSND